MYSSALRKRPDQPWESAESNSKPLRGKGMLGTTWERSVSSQESSPPTPCVGTEHTEKWHNRKYPWDTQPSDTSRWEELSLGCYTTGSAHLKSESMILIVKRGLKRVSTVWQADLVICKWLQLSTNGPLFSYWSHLMHYYFCATLTHTKGIRFIKISKTECKCHKSLLFQDTCSTHTWTLCVAVSLSLLTWNIGGFLPTVIFFFSLCF